MPNTTHYPSMQQSPHQTYQLQQRRVFQTSPGPQNYPLSSYANSNTTVNYSYQTPIGTPLPMSNHVSAYYLDRIDLDNYSVQTLKQIAETILSRIQSKGLKVKISLSDDGLMIDNVVDAQQSWLFKRSELLYLWRDSVYSNLIVVVTRNRSRHHSSRPYAASLFRLRNLDSAQYFLQTAQEFFAKLSESTTNNSSNATATVEKTPKTSNSKSKTKNRLSIHEQLSIVPNKTHQASPRPHTPIRLITRAEFDPGRNASQTPVEPPPPPPVPNRRTYSETASSTDSHGTNSAKDVQTFANTSNDQPEKHTTNSRSLSGEYVAELLRELKELRNEIVTLKIDQRISTNTRSTSTSPMLIPSSSNYKSTRDSATGTTPPSEYPSVPEVNAETQTDFTLITHRRRQLSRKNKKTMIGTGGIANFSKLSEPPPPPPPTQSSARTLSSSSNNTNSDLDDTTQESSSQVNDPSNETVSNGNFEQMQSFIITTVPPRPMLVRNSYPRSNDRPPVTNGNNSMMTNNEEESVTSIIPVTVEKEMPSLFLSATAPSSVSSDFIGPTIPVNSNNSTNFHSFTDTNNGPTEHIYENVPTLMQMAASRPSFYNSSANNSDDQQSTATNNYVYYSITKTSDSVSTAPLSFPQPNGSSYPSSESTLSNSPPSKETQGLDILLSSETLPTPRPQIVSMGRHRSQPVYFANHLTNPMFNLDRQLLINTIANQFGIDLNSPQLQNLITNQHLFVARKRTFANMVWQMTPDEETALTSSTVETISFDPNDSQYTNARSILKAPTKTTHSTSKRRSISWDSALE